MQNGISQIGSLRRRKAKTAPQASEGTTASIETLSEFNHPFPIFNGVPISLKTGGPLEGAVVKWPKITFDLKTEGVIRGVKGIVSRTENRKAQKAAFG